MDNNFSPALRQHRVLTLDEASKALTLERDKTRMVSWLTPYIGQVIDAIKKGRDRVILNGREFRLAPMPPRFPGEYSIKPLSPVGLPCAVFSLDRIERAHNDGTSY